MLTENETTRRDDLVAELDQIKSDIENQAFLVDTEIDELNRFIGAYRDGLQALNSLHKELVGRRADDDRDDLAWGVECAAEVNEPEDDDIDQELRIDLCHGDSSGEFSEAA